MKDIGLSAFSFVSSGKINPLVMVIVLCSVVTGIFFTSQANEDKVLDDALAVRDAGGCDVKTVSDFVFTFANQQRVAKSKGEPYFYSSIEQYNDYIKDKTEDPLKTIFIKAYEKYNDEKKSNAAPIITAEPPPSIDPKIYRLGQMGFAKLPTIINAIIRLIISMALLPLAQIFVSFFFLYTTSGFGLVWNEGISPLLNVMAHMNDNDGEDEKGGEIQPFYKAINETPFFKWWVNELFLSSIYTIFVVVKFITIQILSVSKITVKIVAALILGIISVFLIVRCDYKYKYRQVIMSSGTVTIPEPVQPIQEQPILETNDVAKEVTPSTPPNKLVSEVSEKKYFNLLEKNDNLNKAKLFPNLK
jgi:hypothetical protein